MPNSRLAILFVASLLLSCATPSPKDSSSARKPASVSVSFAPYPDLKWCVATAAHQVEGHNINSDHYQWENGARDRVITRVVEENPSADSLLASMTGPFTSGPIPCPPYDAVNDKDPDRLNSKLFPSADGRGQVVCEVSGRSISYWDHISNPNTRQAEIDLLKRLGISEYRFSIEWARIEPKADVFDSVALGVYADFVKALVENGIEPQVTLFHFTMPQWLRAAGGWEKALSVKHFDNFTRRVYAAMPKDADGKSLVKTWYTFNEPMVHLTAGYVAGVLPPGLKKPEKMAQVLVNMLSAHAASYHTLHDLADAEKNPIRVGIAHHLRIFDPATLEDVNFLDVKKLAIKEVEVVGARIADQFWNWMLFDAIEVGALGLDLSWAEPTLKRVGLKLPSYLDIRRSEIANLKGTQDFLGVNYYTRDLIKFYPERIRPGGDFDVTQAFSPIVNPEAIRLGHINDMHWEIYPEGLHRILVDLQKHGLKYQSPTSTAGASGRDIIISETGIPDAQDVKRQAFLEDHLQAMKRAMDEGVPVKSLCYWTLIDNFEWNSGYYPQFGFYSVDLMSSDQKRTLRPSGQWFANMIHNQGFTPGQ